MNNNTKVPFAALFDFDGVVVDSFQSHYEAWATAYKELFAADIPEFPHDKLAGKSPHIIATYFANEAGQKENAVALFELKGECLHSSTTPPKLLPGVVEIQTLLAKNNIPHGIASNATRMFVKNSVRQLNLGFTSLFGLEDYQKPKPDPEAYKTLARHLKIPIENYDNTWVFEDSITGTQSAVAAGMYPIGILTLNSKQEMMKAGSKICFPTLLEAYQFLAKQGL